MVGAEGVEMNKAHKLLGAEQGKMTYQPINHNTETHRCRAQCGTPQEGVIDWEGVFGGSLLQEVTFGLGFEG